MNSGYRLAASCVTLLALASPAVGQGEAQPRAASSGIAVPGQGSARSRPDVARIDIRVTGSAELTEDALVKYRDARRRLSEGLDKLNLENLRVEERSVGVSSGNSQAAFMAIMNGNATATETAQPTEVSGTIRVSLTSLTKQSAEELLKTVGKVLDAAKDAGGSLGPSAAEATMAMRYGRTVQNSSVRFVLQDLAPLREQAYAAAVENARQRAARLARLTGVELGPVVAVEEVQVSGESDEIASEGLSDLAVTVRLMVRFEIANPAEAKTAVVKP